MAMYRPVMGSVGVPKRPFKAPRSPVGPCGGEKGIWVALPLPPNRGNGRGHWAVQKRLQDAWAVQATVALQNSRKRPSEPLKRFTAHLKVFTKGRANDLDNATARAKPAFDLLKRLGWIVEDGPEHLIRLTVESASDWHHPRLEIALLTV